MTTEEIYKIKPNGLGWRKLPNGNRISVGDDCTFGEEIEFGNWVRFENKVKIGNSCRIGDSCTFGNACELGSKVRIGKECGLGENVKIGSRCELGKYCYLGSYCELGDECELGNWCDLEPNISSQMLSFYFSQLPKLQKSPRHYTKWVLLSKNGRMYSCYDVSFEYIIGETMKCDYPNKRIDLQCSLGIHVLRYGIRPEFVGLQPAGHGLIPLEVTAEPEDIIFGGLPGNDSKLRVSKCKVLRRDVELEKLWQKAKEKKWNE